MGLDFAQSDAHWSYGGFHQFRIKLAKEIGIDLESMQGFGGDIPWINVNDPIEPFLNHSDCDGQLTDNECTDVGPRLIDLVKHWPEDDYNRQQALMLAEDMIDCAKRNHSLDFC
jgi:hypothetical protein